MAPVADVLGGEIRWGVTLGRSASGGGDEETLVDNVSLLHKNAVDVFPFLHKGRS